MTYEELLLKTVTSGDTSTSKALEAVVLIHKPVIHALPDPTCLACQDLYPCKTIWTIENILG